MLLGDTFMKGHYIVHDAENLKMGFGTVKVKPKADLKLLIILLCVLLPAACLIFCAFIVVSCLMGYSFCGKCKKGKTPKKKVPQNRK